MVVVPLSGLRLRRFLFPAGLLVGGRCADAAPLMCGALFRAGAVGFGAVRVNQASVCDLSSSARDASSSSRDSSSSAGVMVVSCVRLR